MPLRLKRIAHNVIAEAVKPSRAAVKKIFSKSEWCMVPPVLFIRKSGRLF